MSKVESPKGSFRMWHTGVIAIIFMTLASYQSASASSYVWLWENVNILGKLGLGATALYYMSLPLVHTRTHLLIAQDKHVRENVLIIATALVICGVFAS